MAAIDDDELSIGKLVVPLNSDQTKPLSPGVASTSWMNSLIQPALLPPTSTLPTSLMRRGLLGSIWANVLREVPNSCEGVCQLRPAWDVP